jgi:uncharacterized MAPEG superfamily protein
MTIPVWALLAFAAWTLVLLLTTVGVYRWTRILTGRAPIRGFRADDVEGSDWYRRAMRAHANCIGNLPVFAAIVFALSAGNVRGNWVDTLTMVIIVARVLQSLVHVSLPQMNTATSIRFAFFLMQIVAMFVLIAMIVGAYL